MMKAKQCYAMNCGSASPMDQWGLCCPEQMAAEHEITTTHGSTQPLWEVTYLLPCSGGLTQLYTHDLCWGCCVQMQTGLIKTWDSPLCLSQRVWTCLYKKWKIYVIQNISLPLDWLMDLRNLFFNSAVGLGTVGPCLITVLYHDDNFHCDVS